MLEWTLNGFLDAGADEVRRSDIRIWVDPDSQEIADALNRWMAVGAVQVLRDPGACREREPFLRMLQRFEVPE